MRATIYLVFVFSSSFIFAQNKSNDTLHINFLYLKKCFLQSSKLTMSNGEYTYNGVKIDSLQYVRQRAFRDYICDTLLEINSTGKYCKFFNKDSITIIEGRWYPEFYTGRYKEYYDDGILKLIGYYSDGKDGLDKGTKIGTWYYYDTKGKLKKAIDYSKKKKGK